MDELIYRVTLDNVNLELEENTLGFCVIVDFGRSKGVYCFNNLPASIVAFESLIPVFLNGSYDESIFKM